MLRKKSKAVPEGNGPIPQDAYVMLGGIASKELRQVMPETMGEALEEITENMRRGNHHLASLEQDARQLRLATEADVTADKKTRERMEGAAVAVQAKRWDSCYANRVQAGPTSSTSFGMKAEPPALPRRMTPWSTTMLQRQSRVSHPWKCAHQQPPVAYVPPAKPLQRQGSPITSRIFGSSQPRRRIIRGHKFNTPRTTKVSGG